jgi:hypothetical protein
MFTYPSPLHVPKQHVIQSATFGEKGGIVSKPSSNSYVSFIGVSASVSSEKLSPNQKPERVSFSVIVVLEDLSQTQPIK